MRVIFMGSDKISLPLLEVLKRKSAALCIVSGPDKPAGRGQEVKPNDVSAWALEKKVELHRPGKLDDAFHAQLKAFAPDIIFVMAYGKILKPALLDMPPLGTWNIHASALPKLRGASPIETAIAVGMTETAVELIKVKPALDSGPIGASIPIAIGQKTAAELRREIAGISAEIVEKNWSALTSGKLLTVTQDESQATYCRILRKEDGWLDPAAPAEVLCNHVRAFAEWPGSAFIHMGERLKIYSARVVDSNANATNAPIQVPPGTVMEVGERLVVATGRGLLEILVLQRSGGKRLGAKDFLRGYPLKVGEKLFGKPLRPLVDTKPFPRGF